MNSFIELIWPLPGETLTSFKQGVEQLCERGAAYVVAYPHLLLHNTPLGENATEHGFVTRSVHDGVAEAEIVVQTADVTGAEDFCLAESTAVNGYCAEVPGTSALVRSSPGGSASAEVCTPPGW